MRTREHLKEWNLFQRAVTLLLAACVILLTAYAALAWFYLSALSRDIAVLSSNQAETGRAFLSIKQQQAASILDAMRGDLSSNLNAIRQELRSLDEKASKAAEVTPPPKSGQ